MHLITDKSIKQESGEPLVVKGAVMTKPLEILVIPDVHLKPYIFDRAEKILESGQASYAVCLGDYVDEWECDNKLDMYQEIFDRMKAFKQKFPETVFLIGNHDFAYLYPEYGCSGHSRQAEPLVRQSLGSLRWLCGEHKVAVRLGKVLFSHAGITASYLNENYATTRRQFNNPKEKFGFHHTGEFIDYVINDMNICLRSEQGHNVLWNNNSPLWARPQHTAEPMFDEGYLQVVGHTPTKKIEQIDNVVSTDAFSLYSWYPFPPFGEEKFIIVNCADKTWRIADE